MEDVDRWRFTRDRKSFNQEALKGICFWFERNFHTGLLLISEQIKSISNRRVTYWDFSLLSEFSRLCIDAFLTLNCLS